jgi:hypothetical protein
MLPAPRLPKLGRVTARRVRAPRSGWRRLRVVVCGFETGELNTNKQQSK